MLHLNAIGTMTLVDEAGNNCAPRGSKALGLIALLALAPGHVRTRQWLQAKLWSERDTGQASGSLRNTLNEIRNALGPHRDLLLTSRQTVAFRAGALSVNFGWPAGLSPDEVEPFENIDVRDAAFEDFIRDVRTRIAAEYASRERDEHRIAKIAPVARRKVQIRQETRGTSAAQIAAHVLSERLLVNLREIDGFDLVVDETPENMRQIALHDEFCVRLILVSIGSDEDVFLSCRIEDPLSGSLLWSTTVVAPGTVEKLHRSQELSRLCVDTVEALYRALDNMALPQNNANSAWLLGQQARDLIFKLDRHSLLRADQLIRRAYELEPRGRYLAWRGFLRDLARFQHRTTSFLEDAADPLELAVEALRHDPNDPVVLTFVSQLEYIVQGNARTSLSMVNRSLDIDPTSPMSWAVLSNSLVAEGRAEDGCKAVERALRLSAGGSHYFFFEHFACMAASAARDYDRARNHATIALLYRPEFISVRRYQVALAIQKADHDAVEREVRAMASQEPGFTPSSLIDPRYPVNTLRRMHLIDCVR